MKKIYAFLFVTLTFISPFSFSDEESTGFYAVEDNGDTITLTENEVNTLESDGEVYMAETSREGYRTISDEEAEFLKGIAKKEVKLKINN